jgi:magnesium-transporting ATPase (P-type)
MNHDTRSLRTASLIAGLALALIVVLAPFGNFVAIEPLLTPGDATKTAQEILNSETLFRWGIASLILTAVLDMIVAVALLTLFEPVNRSVSTMAALFRVAYTAVFLVAIIQLVVALELLDEPDQAMRAIDAYNTIWLVGLIFFGIHLMLIGYLADRSGYMAKVFGILLVVAGLGYLADGFGMVLIPNYSINIAQFTFVGEAALMFWLLIRGTRKDFSRGGADRGHYFAPDSLVSTPIGRQ